MNSGLVLPMPALYFAPLVCNVIHRRIVVAPIKPGQMLSYTNQRVLLRGSPIKMLAHCGIMQPPQQLAEHTWPCICAGN
jgi:hypothetical protein